MGRMLEALARAEARREVPREAPLEESAEDNEVPFIEVGPAHSLEASPAVLAVKLAPRLRIVPKPCEDVGPVLEPLPPCTGSVSFRPLPHNRGLAPPVQRFAKELIAFHQPDHPSSEQYRQLAVTLRQGLAGSSQVLLCSALAPEMGTTTVVLNLAISLARQGGQRIVVVDGHSARPALADRLGLRGRPGLAEVLAGTESLASALQETGLPHLMALTAGEGASAGRLRALDETCRPVLRQLRDRFDMVLIDGPSRAASGETLGLEAACDAVYVVVPAGAAEKEETAEGLRAMILQGIPVLGCIVTG
jgi:Mrp family chromosome partitioning ATPase